MNSGAETPSHDPSPLAAGALTSETIDACIARGRRLRAEAMARHVSMAVAALRRLFAGRRAAQGDRDSTGVWHDLRTPLTAIRSSSELLIDYPDMPQEHRRRFLDAIHEESLRLERTIDDIAARTHAAGSASRA